MEIKGNEAILANISMALKTARINCNKIDKESGEISENKIFELFSEIKEIEAVISIE